MLDNCLAAVRYADGWSSLLTIGVPMRPWVTEPPVTCASEKAIGQPRVQVASQPVNQRSRACLMDAPPGLVIRVNRPDSEEAHLLIRQLDDDLRQRDPGAVIDGLRPQDLADPCLTFLVPRIDGDAAGCGALRPRELGVGEVERLCVRPTFRGRGVARQVLAAIESAAPGGL